MSISKKAIIGKNVVIKSGVIIEDDVLIGDNCYIDYNAIIRSNVTLGEGSFIGSGCIIGEFLPDFFADYINTQHHVSIGEKAIIRSGTIIYGDSKIGNNFMTGHRTTIREKSQIGNHVSIGTLTDIQGDCFLGDYVHLHSNVHIGMKTVIKSYVWVFPYVVFTNDPTPPSGLLLGAEADEFSVICTGSIILPGVKIGKDALVGAATNLTKDIPEGSVAIGNPGKVIGEITKIKDKEGNKVYPWRYHFDRGMPWRGMHYEEWSQTQKDLKQIL